MENFKQVVLVVWRLACAVLLLYFLGSIVATLGTNKGTALRALKSQGYTDIDVKGYAFLGCTDGDLFRTKFSAVKDGEDVQGVVCSGLWTGSLIRTY